MNKIICDCGHSVNLHSDGLPGCTARVFGGYQCECGKIPMVIYEETIDALYAKLELAECIIVNAVGGYKAAIHQYIINESKHEGDKK